MATERCATAWSAAFEKARDPGFADEITVPRDAESDLPATMSLRRSPARLSLSDGARAVYRQDVPGEHYCIREYEDHWTVTFQQHNPRYAPLRYLLADASVTGMLRGAFAGGAGPTAGRGGAEDAGVVERERS